MNNLLAAALAVAAQLGGSPVKPTPAPSVPMTAPAAAPRAKTAASGWASGHGWVTGTAFMHCNAPRGGSGWMSGSASLNGTIPVYGPEGTTGSIRVSGFSFLSGSCRDGRGFASGSGTLSGGGTLYGSDGKPAGAARVSGTVFVSEFVNGTFVWIHQPVAVSGPFTAN